MGEEMQPSIAELHIMRIDEMPRIELYLDQVLTLVDESLGFMAVPGEPILTGSMVNNYVKQRVIPAPQKKRYTRRQLALLLFVSAFKRVFSIAQIKELLAVSLDGGERGEGGAGGGEDARAASEAQLYDNVCSALEYALAERFGEAPTGEPPVLESVLAAAVDSLAAKVYVEKSLEAAA